MFFSNWKTKSTEKTISPTLLWEYDLSNFDWDIMRTTVMQRVIERGWMNDYYAAINLYGGIRNVQAIIKEIPYLSDEDMDFVSVVFQINKEEMKCYTRKLSRERLFNSLKD